MLDRAKPLHLMTHFVLLGAILALFVFIYFLLPFSTAWSMRGWQLTQGRVVAAEMRRGKNKSPDGCLLYGPVLRCSYTVGGQTAEGSRFTHQAVSHAPILTIEFITRLKLGAKVPVYYHQRNPAEAVVQLLSWQGSATATLVCALFLIVLAAALWFT